MRPRDSPAGLRPDVATLYAAAVLERRRTGKKPPCQKKGKEVPHVQVFVGTMRVILLEYGLRDKGPAILTCLAACANALAAYDIKKKQCLSSAPGR